MGQFESHLKSGPALRVLFDLPPAVVEFALAKLEQLSKERFQNQINKWDLMAHLSLKADDAEKLIGLLSSTPGSLNVSIHLVMVAVVLCQEVIEPDQLMDKVHRIFKLVSFMIDGSNLIQKSEVRYIYHLAELWIAAIQNGQLPAVAQPDCEVVAQLHLLETTIFPDPHEEFAVIDHVCAFIQQQQETVQFLALFQDVPDQVQAGVGSIRSQLSSQPSIQPGQNVGSSTRRKSLILKRKLTSGTHAGDNDINSIQKQIEEFKTLSGDHQLGVVISNLSESRADSHSRTPGASANQSRRLLNSRGEEIDQYDPNESQDHEDSNASSNDGEEVDDSDPEDSRQGAQPEVDFELMTPNSDTALPHQRNMTFGPGLDLYWTTDVIQGVIAAYNSKMLTQNHDIAYMARVQAKLASFRDQTKVIVESDRAVNLKDLADKLEKIEAHHVEYFGHRQLAYMMRSFFFSQQLINTGFSISEYVGQQLQQVRSSEEFVRDFEDDKAFEDVMTRACLAQAFKEYYKRGLIQMKYELKCTNARILSHLSHRGQQRILLKKKYKTLGELCSIAQMLKLVEKNRASLGTEKISKSKHSKRGSLMMNGTSQMSQRLNKGNQNKMASSLKLPVRTSALPSENQIFTAIYNEIYKLRNCRMGRRDLMRQMNTKEVIKTLANSISFWEGVLALIEEAVHINTFAKLRFFKDFFEFGETQLAKDEHLYKTALLERQHHRQSFLTYNSQIGKLKGLACTLATAQAHMTREDRFHDTLKKRTQVLMARLEKIDFKLTELVSEKIETKATAKAHYKALGKVSAYRTVVKSLPLESIIDYLMIGMAKARTQEIVTLIAFQDRYSCPKQFTEAKLLASLQKMKTIATLDQAFNLSEGAAQSAQIDPQGEHARYQDELNQIVEMQRLMGEAPDHPVIENLNQAQIKKEMLHTVATMITQFCTRQRIPVSFVAGFQEFAEINLKKPSYSLTSSLTYKTLDLEDAGKVLFDFVEVEERNNVKTDDIISWMGNLSCSLKQTYYQGPVEQLITHKQEAHMQCQRFAQSMLDDSQSQYLGKLRQSRVEEFRNFIQVLKGTNRGHLFNNLDCQFMSLPLEYSLENNFWLAQALSLQLSYYEQETKFAHFDCVHSPILLSKRSLSLKKKIAAQLILAAFSVGPQSVRGSDKSDQDEEMVWVKDKVDFEKQFVMTNGVNFKELQVKRYLFGDAEEYLRIRKEQSAVEQKVRNKYLQDQGSGKYQSTNKNALNSLIRDLNDEAYDKEVCGSVQDILLRYEAEKAVYFESEKQTTVIGVISGARNFLSKIIKLQTKVNSFGQNQTLLKLQGFIEQISKNVMEMRTIIGSPRASQPPISPGGMSAQDSHYRGRNEQTQITVSTVNSHATEVSYVGSRERNNESPTKQSSRAAKGKKKAKNEEQGSKLELIEREVINLIGRTKELYQMVSDARNCSDVNKFFTGLSEKYDSEHTMNEKMKSTHQYLQTNTTLMPILATPKSTKSSDAVQVQIRAQLTLQKLNADKIGAKLMQDVQAGLLVSPVFVFQPSNAGQKGLPPLYMTKLNELVKDPAVDSSNCVSDVESSQLESTPRNKDAKMQMIEESEAESLQVSNAQDAEVNSSQLTTRAGAPKDLQELSEHQKAINLVLQFIDLVSQMDDKLTIKNLNRKESLTAYIQLAKMDIERQMTQFQVQKSIARLQQETINVFQLRSTPVEHILKSFQRTQKFIQRDMLAVLQKTNQEHLGVFFDNVIARADPTLIKQVVSNVESYYQNVDMEEGDKLDFLTAQVKIRRDLDQRLHTFKEYIDLEENKKASQRHQSLIEHQRDRVQKEIASLHVLVRTYYLKQVIV